MFCAFYFGHSPSPPLSLSLSLSLSLFFLCLPWPRPLCGAPWHIVAARIAQLNLFGLASLLGLALISWLGRGILVAAVVPRAAAAVVPPAAAAVVPRAAAAVVPLAAAVCFSFLLFFFARFFRIRWHCSRCVFSCASSLILAACCSLLSVLQPRQQQQLHR